MNMELGENTINAKFDEVEDKIDFIIKLCREFQLENQELSAKIKDLETQLEVRRDHEIKYSQQDVFVRSKIDGLLNKLEAFTAPEPGSEK